MASKTLDLEAMDERDLLDLLARLYGEFLERLSVHEDVGEGDPIGDRTGTVSSPVPAALEAGVVLAARLKTLTDAFIIGNQAGIIPANDGESSWTAGVIRFEQDLKAAASRPEVINA